MEVFGIIGFIQNRKIIKESKDQWNASGSNKVNYLSIEGDKKCLQW